MGDSRSHNRPPNRPPGKPSHHQQREQQQGGKIDGLLARISFSKDALPVEIFSDIAEQAADIISQSARHQNRSTQLRKFYDELLMWNDAIQQEQGHDARAAKYTELAPFIKMLKAKVAYARGRGHVDREFEKLFARCIDAIDSYESLRYGKFFMEAFMGYYRTLKGD